VSGTAWSAWAITATAVLALVAVCAAVGLWHHRRGAARLARCAHELRGPLGALRLGLDLALRRGGLAPERVRALDLQLRRATLALAELTGAAGIGAGAGEAAQTPELIDARELVRDCLGGLEALAISRGVRLSLAGGPVGSVLGVRPRLAQALSNLIANAIEHGAGEVTVLVGTVPAARAGRPARLRLEVHDDGPGLPGPLPELLRRRPSRRAHGHGLAVAAAVAEGHGGRLLSAPAPRGARIVLELPAPEAVAGPRSRQRRHR
jgi:signal transduction histidine kinase